MILEGFLAIIIFAFVPLAIKFTMASPLTICLFRLLIAVVALSLYWRKKISFNSFFNNVPGFWKLWLIGFIFFLHWITYAYAVKLGGPSIGVLGLSTYGIQLVVAGLFFLGHRLTKKDIFCLALSMLGLFFIVPSWNFSDESTVGLGLALLSATCFAILPIVHKKSQEFSQETRIFAQFFGALVCFTFFIGKTNWNLSTGDWGALIFLGIFGTLIAHSLWARVSSTVSATHTGLAYYTIAPLAIVLSHLFLGESITMIQLFGGLIVISASMINLR